MTQHSSWFDWLIQAFRLSMGENHSTSHITMHAVVGFAAFTAIVVVAVTISSMIVIRYIRLEIIDPIASKFESFPTVKLSANVMKGIIQGAVDGAEVVPNDAARKTAFEVARGFKDESDTRKQDASPVLPH